MNCIYILNMNTFCLRLDEIGSHLSLPSAHRLGLSLHQSIVYIHSAKYIARKCPGTMCSTANCVAFKIVCDVCNCVCMCVCVYNAATSRCPCWLFNCGDGFLILKLYRLYLPHLTHSLLRAQCFLTLRSNILIFELMKITFNYKASNLKYKSFC